MYCKQDISDIVGTANESILERNRKPTDVVCLVTFGLFLVVLVCNHLINRSSLFKCYYHTECISSTWLFYSKFALLGYCMHYGNIYRILNGYDNCGNVCGRINVFDCVNSTGCHGMDMTQHKYLRVQSWGSDSTENIQVNRICVENCNNYSGL